MRQIYGNTERDMEIMLPILQEEKLPIIGYVPNHNGPLANGKFVITYPDGHKETIKEDKSSYSNTYFTNIGHLQVLWDLRMKALNHEPIELTR